MIIRRVWWQPFRIPYRAELITSYATETAREGVVLGIETDDGRVGIGEASPLTSYAGGTVADVDRISELMAKSAIGQSVETIWDTFYTTPTAPLGAIRAAECGIETAAVSLLASQANVSMATWMAARDNSITNPVARSVQVNGTIDAQDIESCARQAHALVTSGFGVIKVKVGRDHNLDLRRVSAILQATEHGVAVRIDPNGAWTLAEAEAKLADYAQLGVELCEQPLSAEDENVIDNMAELRARSAIPIAADESCRDLAAVTSIIMREAADALVIKPTIVGLETAVSMVALARMANVPLIITSAFDAGIATAAAVHLAATLGSATAACGLATLSRLEDDLILGGLEIERGRISVPQGSGLGVELDVAALERYATGPRREVAA